MSLKASSAIMLPRSGSLANEGSRPWVVASYLVLGIPLALLVLIDGAPPGAALLWLLGLLPILVSARPGGWRPVAVAGGIVTAVIVLTHLVLAAAGRPVPDLLPATLAILIATTIGVGWLATRIGQNEGEDEESALTDPLTGLPNRRHARVFLETMFGAAERGRPVTVILFDLDHFRGYNDRHGHQAGAAALRHFADLLSASTRRMNLSARIGGEEFLSVLAGAEEEGARAFADRIRESLQSAHLERGNLTVSAGVAAYHPSMRSPEELLASADLALFRAKEEGRNRVRVFGKDVGSDDAREARRTSGPVEVEGSAGTPRYGEDPARFGKTAPPRELLPDAIPQFGTGRTILLVEHGTELEEAVGGYLRREGFELTTIPDASSAIQALGREFDLVLTDLHLPGLSGTELVRAVKSRWPATQVLVVAEAGDTQFAADALSAGGDRFLHQPISLPEFQTHLIDALARHDRIRSEHRRRHRLSKESFERADESRGMVVQGILSLARAAELYDAHSQGHAQRVAAYALAIHHGLRDRSREIDAELLNLACLVHNVGMLEVPPEILNKTGPLTPEEFERVRRHPVTGRQILEPVLGDELILAVTGWHHERWDGTGYPDGLAGEAIPLAARVVAMADALDAMTSSRPYRRALTWEDAVRQIRDRAGTHFDPGLIEAFNAALPDLHRRFLRQDPAPETTGETEASIGP